MDKFLTARYRALESVSDIIGIHNYTQTTNQSSFDSPRKYGTYETVATNIPQKSVQFVVRITLFVCVLIF